MPSEIPPLPLAIASHKDSASISLRKIADWDEESKDIYQVVATAFAARDYLDCIKNLQASGINPKSYINGLDKIIDGLPNDSDLRRLCVRALRKTCGIYGILPTLYTITHSLKNSSPRPFASGGFADVWKLANEQNTTFAVKSIRVYESDPVEKISKKYCKEVVVCKRARHENILTIEGVAPHLFEFCMVSRWMDNGDLLNYVKTHPGANRLDLLIGVTRGLDYLHRNDIVHGDLKSSNILIDVEGRPRLTDFGLYSINVGLGSDGDSPPHHGLTARYCAPELLEQTEWSESTKNYNVRYTKNCDVYSLSMIIAELATGEVPFPELRDFHIISVILKGKRPRKPRSFEAQGITLEVWKVAQRCWRHRARNRPEVQEVLRNLEDIANHGDKRRSSPFKKAWHDIFGLSFHGS